jgi:hypothetical protein
MKTNQLVSKRFSFRALFVFQLLVSHALLNAQTVGPDIILRNSTSGSAAQVNAVFDNGATFIAWQDTRTEGSSGGDIYVQKMGSDGQALWTPNGLAVCVATNEQSWPSITADGKGGAVVTWVDNGSATRGIYAQRIDASGAVQWAANGVPVGIVYEEQPSSFVHRTDDGGFLVTWWDSSPLSNIDKYPVLAQKLNANGVPLWDLGAATTQDLWGSGIEVLDGIIRGRSVPDGAGGFVALGKIRDDGGYRFQRVLANGTFAWPKPIDFIASLSDFDSTFNFASDGAGGVIVAYVDYRDVRAFRVAADGTFPWGNNGITLQENAIAYQIPAIAPNGSGGAFIAWVSSTPRDILVQQIAADGSLLWSTPGAAVPDGSTFERDPALLLDGAGGIYISFATATSVRANRLDSKGAAQWKINGSNGVGLGAGELPFIGPGASGPTVVTTRGAGVFARQITVSSVLQLSSIASANGKITFKLTGGAAGHSYQILRSSAVGSHTGQTWNVIGTAQSGQTFTDTAPLAQRAFYSAQE